MIRSRLLTDMHNVCLSAAKSKNTSNLRAIFTYYQEDISLNSKTPNPTHICAQNAQKLTLFTGNRDYIRHEHFKTRLNKSIWLCAPLMFHFSSQMYKTELRPPLWHNKPISLVTLFLYFTTHLFVERDGNLHVIITYTYIFRSLWWPTVVMNVDKWER